nr:MAG TPA: hypothetical protein [Caudoviricetes sp.]
MSQSEYFRNKAVTYLACVSDVALNAGVDAVGVIVALDVALPYTPRDYMNALTAWLQGRYDVWQSRIDDYEADPTDEKYATIAGLALSEHTPHTQQDFDDIVEMAYRLAVDETLIENELEKRRNNGK